jgi:hypothetical protein
MTRQWSLTVSALSIVFGGHEIPSCHSEPGGGETSSDASSQDASSDGSAASSEDGGVAVADASAFDGAASDGGACAVFDAGTLDDASVAAGFEAVWQTYRCWSCHQNASQTVSSTGEGLVLSGNNRGLGDAGTTFPPNLTDDPSTGVGCWTDQELIAAILDGKDRSGGMLCPSMPRWGSDLTTADGGPRPGTPMDAGTAQQVVDFMRSLPPVVNAVPETTCASKAEDAGVSADAAAGD